MNACLPAVFCDRDGVIVRDTGYLCEPSQIEILEGVPSAIRLLRKNGFLILVVTNQSGVARGHYSESAVQLVNRTIVSLLAREDAQVDSFYYCPHHPQAVIARYRQECNCRKPKPGMLLRAAGEFGIDFSASFVIGDKTSDIAAGMAVGARSVLINSDAYVPVLNDGKSVQADWIALNLLEAAKWILNQAHTNRPI